jgi:hypothetical protein
MADKKISELTELTDVDSSNDVLAIVDVSDTSSAASGTTKKVKPQNFPISDATQTALDLKVSNNQSDSTPINTIRKLTQAEYDAITPDANTFYIVT